MSDIGTPQENYTFHFGQEPRRRKTLHEEAFERMATVALIWAGYLPTLLRHPNTQLPDLEALFLHYDIPRVPFDNLETWSAFTHVIANVYPHVLAATQGQPEIIRRLQPKTFAPSTTDAATRRYMNLRDDLFVGLTGPLIDPQTMKKAIRRDRSGEKWMRGYLHESKAFDAPSPAHLAGEEAAVKGFGQLYKGLSGRRRARYV